MTTPDKMSLKEENDSENVTAALNEMSLKEEKDSNDMAHHPHELLVTFDNKEELTIWCEKPCTVLEAVKSLQHEELKCPDDKIIIQLGKADKENIVATHFPCSCVPDKELLIVSSQSKEVETPDEHETIKNETIKSRDKYSVFYIDTIGGLNTKTKKLFRNNAVKKYKYLCVYGEKGWTVEEALKRDGRFIDNLGNFKLSDNDDPNRITKRTQKVDNLDGKKIKIRLPRNKGATENSVAVSEAARKRGISVSKEVGNTEEIHESLRQQFSDLKKWIKDTFTESSYQEKLGLREKDFRKIQKLFNEVHRVRKLLEMGESVCKVVVEDNDCVGTGFVLFDNFILTNAHLFKSCVEGDRLKEGINVYTLFNYDDPEPHTNYYSFKVVQSYICFIDKVMDYAILELNREGHMLCDPTTQTDEATIPPGLLKHFGPVPESGEACLIGHPAGEVKKIDPTCVIEKENRKQAAKDELTQYSNSPFIVHIINQLKSKEIDDIMMGGQRADKVSTYKTFMYHGSSGSPVFDAHCRVFGLHTAGFTYDIPQGTESVIEYAQHLLTIFKHLLCKMKGKLERESYLQVLKKVKKEAKGNSYLEEVLKSVGELIESTPELPSGSGEVVKIEPADSVE